MKFRFACTGGTFDRLHNGHDALLKKAFAVADKVLIGLTSDSMVRKTKQFHEIVKPYAKRKKELEAFLKKHGWLSRAKIVVLNDVSGPTVEKGSKVDCIVTSRKTLAGAREINKRRRKNRLKPLPIAIVKIINSEDAKPISSTRMRKGQIDRAGHVFEKSFTCNLRMTPETNRFFKKPFGKLVRTAKASAELRKLSPFKTIVVGDETAKVFETQGLKAAVVVVDGKIRRKKTSFTPSGRFHKTLRIANKHGTIGKHAARVVERAVEAKNHDRILVHVRGEEDLLTLPAVLFAPLESVVCYGQPGKGMVLVKVSEEKKRQALAIALKMKA
ncbi:MAG: pantetheine-phosphate adenylyltransferase [Candidatus Norongarragalinales archaeon]